MKETFKIDKDWTNEVFKAICTGWAGSMMLFPIKGNDGNVINITIYPETITDAIAVSADLQVRRYQASEHISPRTADEIK